VNLPAWNAGVGLAGLALMAWWRSDGERMWKQRGLKCRDCGRAKASCSCVDVVFTPDDIWDDKGEE
jgi:hypothetical protein